MSKEAEAYEAYARQIIRDNYPLFAIIRLILWWRRLIESHGWRSHFAEGFEKAWFQYDE